MRNKSKIARWCIHSTALLFLLAFIASLSGCARYKVEGQTVYYCTRNWDTNLSLQKTKIAADGYSFQVLKYDNWGKDKNTVFYKGRVVDHADAPSFLALSQYYGRDKDSAWYQLQCIKGAHGKTFHLLKEGYATDGHDLFYMWVPFHSPAPDSFRILSIGKWHDYWTTDGQYYYYQGQKIPSDDYAHVTLFPGSDGIAKDRHWVYFDGGKMNYNYKGNKIIDTIDAASFEVENYLDCHDKWGCINPFLGREDCVDKK